MSNRGISTIVNLDNNETLAPSDTPSNPEENLYSIDIREEISHPHRLEQFGVKKS